MSDGPEWFAPKRYGYGAGWPISWQGWALSIVSFAMVVGLTAMIGEDRPLPVLAAIIPVIAVFILITARTTRGGWRWRWGEDE